MACEGTPKCCKPICAISWLILLIIVTLGSLIYFRDCRDYTSIGLRDDEKLAFYFAMFYFLFVAFSAFVFIVLTKTDSACRCCGKVRILWAVVHVGGGVAAFVLLYKFKSAENIGPLLPTLVQKKRFVLSRLRLEDPYTFPNWFIDFHTTQQCCGLYSSYTDPKLLTDRCDQLFKDNPNLEVGCGLILYELYEKCTKRTFWYAVATLILGLLPFVIYALNYSYINKIRNKAVGPTHPRPIGPRNKEQPKYDRQKGPADSALAGSPAARQKPASRPNTPADNNNNQTRPPSGSPGSAGKPKNKAKDTKIDMNPKAKPPSRTPSPKKKNAPTQKQENTKPNQVRNPSPKNAKPQNTKKKQNSPKRQPSPNTKKAPNSKSTSPAKKK